MFGCRLARSRYACCAESAAPRCRTTTRDANCASVSASCSAESPPPTTPTPRWRSSGPSQRGAVAHALAPQTRRAGHVRGSSTSSRPRSRRPAPTRRPHRSSRAIAHRAAGGAAPRPPNIRPRPRSPAPRPWDRDRTPEGRQESRESRRFVRRSADVRRAPLRSARGSSAPPAPRAGPPSGRQCHRRRWPRRIPGPTFRRRVNGIRIGVPAATRPGTTDRRAMSRRPLARPDRTGRRAARSMNRPRAQTPQGLRPRSPARARPPLCSTRGYGSGCVSWTPSGRVRPAWPAT